MLADQGERDAVHAYIAARASRGLRAIGVAESPGAGDSWRLVGLISLLDPPRPDSAATIKRAQELGVEVRPADCRHPELAATCWFTRCCWQLSMAVESLMIGGKQFDIQLHRPVYSGRSALKPVGRTCAL